MYWMFRFMHYQKVYGDGTGLSSFGGHGGKLYQMFRNFPGRCEGRQNERSRHCNLNIKHKSMSHVVPGPGMNPFRENIRSKPVHHFLRRAKCAELKGRLFAG